VVASFSNTASSAAVLGNQTYEPYGKAQYQQGSMDTTRGYTGQENDSLSGLDYYGARYYDPVSDQFLSPDSVQGNAQGMDPYSYVAGNPETATDPTGQMYTPGFPGDGGVTGGSTASSSWGAILDRALKSTVLGLLESLVTGSGGRVSGDVVGQAVRREKVEGGIAGPGEIEGGVAGPGDVTGGVAGPGGGPPPGAWPPPPPPIPPIVPPIIPPIIPPIVPPFPGGPGSGPGGPGNNPGGGPGSTGGGGSSDGGPCSFTPDTQVMTNHGKTAIGDLHVGGEVLAYNPKTHKMEYEPIQHVWVHVDSDLVNLTITTVTPAHNGKPATKKSEVIDTTSEHPFMTEEKGFVPAGKVKVGMHILRADGSYGIVTGWKAVHTTKVMYNLEVAQDHTFAVGDGEWVVHNRCGPVGTSGGGPGIWELTNEAMSPRAAEYQQQITGCPVGMVYRVGGVKFDGFDGKNLLDAKGPGYARFLDSKTGGFKSWWRGANDLIDEANRQLGVAGTCPIIWHVAEEAAYNAIDDLFSDNGVSGIDLRFTPPT